VGGNMIIRILRTTLLLVISLITTNYSQSISFIPKSIAVNAIGSCTPPGLKFSIHPGILNDSIIVFAAGSQLQCNSHIPNGINYSGRMFFLIKNKVAGDKYDLVLKYNSDYLNNRQKITLDSTFFLVPDSSQIKLRINRNGVCIDSLSQNFYSITTGLFVENNISNIPAESKIISAFPNPFNPSTKIAYELKQSEYIKLSVYNVLGELVEVLEHKYKSPGKYQISWNANSKTSGLYFIVLATRNYYSTRKIILLK
jgi:hypothetical protein